LFGLTAVGCEKYVFLRADGLYLLRFANSENWLDIDGRGLGYSCFSTLAALGGIKGFDGEYVKAYFGSNFKWEIREYNVCKNFK